MFPMDSIQENEKSGFQMVVEFVQNLVFGIIAVGVAFDAIANANSLMSIPVATIITAIYLLVLVVIYSPIALGKLKWVTKEGKRVNITGLGKKTNIKILGGFLLIWSAALYNYVEGSKLKPNSPKEYVRNPADSNQKQNHSRAEAWRQKVTDTGFVAPVLIPYLPKSGNNRKQIEADLKEFRSSLPKPAGPTLSGIEISEYKSSDFKKYGKVKIKAGHYVTEYSPATLFLPQYPMQGMYSKCTDNHFVSLIVENHKMYVSARFNRLEDGEEIGDMAFNRWRVWREKIGDYNYTDSSFEVKDPEGHVAFSICNHHQMQSPLEVMIEIKGYLMDARSIVIFNNLNVKPFDNGKGAVMHYDNDCFSRDTIESYWKGMARMAIEGIQSIFPER